MKKKLDKPIACVSGASGVVGSRISEKLISLGYRVRALSRQKRAAGQDIEWLCGDITDEEVVKVFVQGARLFFHCAAELNDESRMWAVNVKGTEIVLRCAEESGIKFFCHLSSVGVIGETDSKLVDESTPCRPQNAYEKSKWAAEQLVMRGMNGSQVVILRPTNVIDEKRLGILALLRRRSLADFCKAFLKGGEHAHIVHAEDVAAAAVHLISHPLESPQCYIVSCDQERLKTFAQIGALYKTLSEGHTAGQLRPLWHLPASVPYFLRKIGRGHGGNKGDICYSSEKLMRTSFNYPLGVQGAVGRIVPAAGGVRT